MVGEGLRQKGLRFLQITLRYLREVFELSGTHQLRCLIVRLVPSLLNLLFNSGQLLEPLHA